MAATGKLKLDDVLLVADLVKGNVSRAAERLGVQRSALRKYLKRHQGAADRFAQWRERLVDEAETALWDCVQEKQPWAVSLVLKTLGKFRGYIEPQHLTPTGQCRLPQGHDEDEQELPRPARHRWESFDEPDWPEVKRSDDDPQPRAEDRQPAPDVVTQVIEAPLPVITPEPAAEADDPMRAEIQELINEARRRLGKHHGQDLAP